MLALTFLVALQARPTMVAPPMRRLWTVLSGDRTELHGVTGGVACYSSAHEVGAVSLSTGKRVWTKKLEGGKADAADSDGSIFMLLYAEKRSRSLISFRKKDGAKSTFTTYTEEVNSIACDAKRVYVLFANGRVDALDRQTTRRLWSARLLSGTGRGVTLCSLTAGYGKVYAGIQGAGFHCLQAGTGKLLWKANAQYGVYEPPILTDAGPITTFSGLTLHDAANGKAIWTRPAGYLDIKAIVGGVLIGANDGRLTGYSLSNGKVLWQEPPLDPNAGVAIGNRADWPLAPADQVGVLVVRDDVQKVSKTGKILWRRKPFFSGSPVYADSKFMLTNDGERLLCYAHGDYPPLPTDPSQRKDLADRLATGYEKLDSVEIKRFTKLAPLGAKTLISSYARWAKEHGGDDLDSGHSLRYYSLLTDAEEVLSQVCSAGETQALLDAIDSLGPKNDYAGELVRVLGRKGDPAKVIPAYVALLRSKLDADPKTSGQWGDSTLDIVARSSHPEAVSFMIQVLSDPKAPMGWRHEAFVHLAGTGGEAGREAIRAARAARDTVQSWQKNLESQLTARSVVAEDVDAKGQTWRLVSGYVLGSGGDLFLQQKVNGTWSEPIFTGLTTASTFTAESPATLRGVPVKKFLANDWIRILPGDPSLRTDQDGDGWTDLVEKRLGTDPAKADTDDDGVVDAIDPCPNAAPRVLGDREKIIAASIEARFFAEPWGVPAILEVPGVKPFEMDGYRAPLLWKSARTDELAAMYGAGVNMLSFHSEQDREKGWVTIAANGQSADTVIRRYSGGLNGDGIAVHLIKVGEEWFVTEMRMVYVS